MYIRGARSHHGHYVSTTQPPLDLVSREALKPTVHSFSLYIYVLKVINHSWGEKSLFFSDSHTKVIMYLERVWRKCSTFCSVAHEIVRFRENADASMKDIMENVMLISSIIYWLHTCKECPLHKDNKCETYIKRIKDMKWYRVFTRSIQCRRGWPIIGF